MTVGGIPRIARGLVRVVLFAVALSLAATASGHAERRVALVIANGSYEALPSLVNPTTDGSDMASLLESLDFEVHTAFDADGAAFRAALDRFEGAIADADVALFYFAGHGLQVAHKNYLVPVDAVLRSEADVYAAAFSFDGIVARMSKAPGLKIVFLDACQDNPLPASSGQREPGLARVGTAEDVLITYATQPGRVAYDGVGRNSPFTDALLNHLPRRGVEVLPMLAAVNADVNAATGGRQTPYVQFSVKPEFYFAPGEPDDDTPDLQLWRVAAKAEDAALLEIYLARFPDGPYAADARALLARLDPAELPAAGGAALEDTLWRLARTARSHALVELYVTRYPDGRYAGEARRLLETLAPEDDPDAPAGTRCARLATHPRDATAGIPGVSMDVLARNASVAVDVCRRAVATHPDLPRFLSHLARAEAARGNIAEAVRLFREAADRGDGRALSASA
jgi:uncharacterized caspase-like protein